MEARRLFPQHWQQHKRIGMDEESQFWLWWPWTNNAHRDGTLIHVYDNRQLNRPIQSMVCGHWQHCRWHTLAPPHLSPLPPDLISWMLFWLRHSHETKVSPPRLRIKPTDGGSDTSTSSTNVSSTTTLLHPEVMPCRPLGCGSGLHVSGIRRPRQGFPWNTAFILQRQFRGYVNNDPSEKPQKAIRFEAIWRMTHSVRLRIQWKSFIYWFLSPSFLPWEAVNTWKYLAHAAHSQSASHNSKTLHKAKSVSVT
jgi:hypothetical protein